MLLSLVLIVIALFAAFIVPVNVLATGTVLLIAIAFVVRGIARAVTGNEATLGESFKAVGLSLFFLFIAITAVMSAGSRPGGLNGIPALLGVGAMFVAYTAGFVVALGASFRQSALIAVVSTSLSAVLVYAATRI